MKKLLSVALAIIGLMVAPASATITTINSTTFQDLGAAPLSVEAVSEPVVICVQDSQPSPGTACSILNPGVSKRIDQTDGSSHVWAAMWAASTSVASGAAQPTEVSGGLGGFQPTIDGTPITATTGGATGSVPATPSFEFVNIGPFPAYCAFGAAVTTSNRWIAVGGIWGGTRPTGSTQLTCMGVGGTTTVNVEGGTGLAFSRAGGALGTLGSGVATALGLPTNAAGGVVVYANLATDAFLGSDGVINGTALTSLTHSCTVADVGKVVVYDIGGPGTPIADPVSAPTLGQTSGGNGSTTGTFFVKVWYDAPQATGAQGTSAPSAEASLVVTSNNRLTITSPPRVVGARGWHVGIGSTTGSEVQQDDQTTYIPIGTTWTMVLAGLINQGAAPSSNNTAQGFVLHTKVDACSGAGYTLHNAGPSPVTRTATGSFTTASATIPLGAGNCPSPTPAVGSSVWDASLGGGTPHPAVIGTYASCDNATGAVSLGASPYTGSTNPGIASRNAADVLTFGGTGFFSIFTDNSAALASLVASNPRAKIVLPCGNIGLDATTVALDFITLEGCGQLGNLFDFNAAQVNVGTSFFLGSLTTIPFTEYRSVTVKGIAFFYPGQMGTQPAPQVFPQMVADDGTHGISAQVWEDVTLFNTFAWMTQYNWTGNWSNSEMLNVHGYIVDSGINRPNQGETLFMSDSRFNCNTFHGVCANAQSYLQNYSDDYADFEIIPGDGDGTNCSVISGSTGHEVNNSTFHNFNHILHIAGGTLTESKFVNIDAGQINAALFVSPLGAINNSLMINNSIFQNTGSTGSEPNIDVQSTCSQKGNIYLTAVSLVDDYGAISVTGGQLTTFSMTGGQINAGNKVGLLSPVYLANLNDTNLDFDMSGVNWADMTTHGINYAGISITAVKMASISGDTFFGAYSVLDTSSMTAGIVSISGNTSLSTNGATSIITGTTGFANIAFGTNNFDKPVFPTATFTGPLTNQQVYFPAGFSKVHIDGCGSGGAGGAGVVAATSSGGAGGAGGDCVPSYDIDVADLGSGPYYVNGGGGGTGGAGNGGNGVEITFSKKSTGCTAFSTNTFTGPTDTTHCAIMYGSGGGGGIGVAAAVSVGGAGAVPTANGAQASSAATSGCPNSGGGSGASPTNNVGCGGGGGGGVNGGVGSKGAIMPAGFGGAGGGAGGGVSAGVGQTGGNGVTSATCQTNPTAGTGGASATDGASGALNQIYFSYMTGCSGAGGGGASSGTAGAGGVGGRAAGGGGGGSANTGGTAGNGGNGGAGFLHFAWHN